MIMRPSEIRFSQDSIANRFGEYSNHPDRPIGDTLDDLLLGNCSPFDIPCIRVSERNGKYYTADNRRLWVFQKAEELGAINDIPVKNGYIKPEKFTTTNEGVTVNVRGNPGGNVWRSRDKKRHIVKRQGNNVAHNFHKNKNVARIEETVPVYQSYRNEGTYSDEAFTNVIRTQRNVPVVHRYTDEINRPRTDAVVHRYTDEVNRPRTDAVVHRYTDEVNRPRTDAVVHRYTDEVNRPRTDAVVHRYTDEVNRPRTDAVVHRYTDEVNRPRTSGIPRSFKPASNTNNRSNPYQVWPTPSRTDRFEQSEYENHNTNQKYKHSYNGSDQTDREMGCCYIL